MKIRAATALAALALGGAVPLLGATSASAIPPTKCNEIAKQMITTKDLTPIRAGYSSTARVITNLGKGYKVRLVQQCVNSKGNLWYFTDAPYSHGWIYSGNLRNG
ncbi:hypothetical protein ACH4UM_28065 [Streptomyces sp. NPDC020801]|uniref:hypothetical protein n=1 Tax=Streptomyces sp. NPDC020801 TaxID=3365093 RepID=UPI0037976ADB